MHPAIMDSAETEHHETCKLIQGQFSLVIQGFLAVSVGITLVAKYVRERNRVQDGGLLKSEQHRSIKVWLFDTSKQGIAMGLQHFVNIFLAQLFAGQGADAGQCIWYITNYSITITCGLFVIATWMRFQRALANRFPNCSVLQSGNYGDPPSVVVWLQQMCLWGMVAVGEKLLVARFVIVPLHGYIDHFLVRLQAPLLPHPHTELVLVMIVGPNILNAIYAWIVDNFLKHEVVLETTFIKEEIPKQETVVEPEPEDQSALLKSRQPRMSVAQDGYESRQPRMSVAQDGYGVK